MKHLLLAITAALMLAACATSDTMVADESSNKITEKAVMETDTMMESESMMEEDVMTESDTMLMEDPAAPAASVDCTGLTDDACMAKIMNFGDAPAPAEAMPVEPVDMELMPEPESEPMMNADAPMEPEG